MSEPYEIKKAKIDNLVISFCNSGYRSNNKIGQTEVLQYLSKRTSSGFFDQGLTQKLFQVLSLDNMTHITVEDFINGYLQFDEDLRKNAEILKYRLRQEQELYANLVEQLKKYKSEKLNSEGMCENAKVFGEITDINIKRKLDGIKEIYIKIIYNENSDELRFKIGDANLKEMVKRTFEFKPTSRKDHFEFIMKGVNDRNQVFDIGNKVFSLMDVNSHEEYEVQIVVPEIDNEDEIAAYINVKIVLYLSDYKYYERLKRKSERRLKKLIAAMNKATQYLSLVKEIYGDLSKQRSELIVDFNNEKIMQKRPVRLKVNFNNTKEADNKRVGNFLVEFNNQKDVKSAESVKIKEVKVQTKIIKEETIQENLQENEENEENVGLAKVKQSKLMTQANQPMSQNDEENDQDNLTDNDNDNENEEENDEENEENEEENEENEEENEVLSPVYVSDNQNADAAYLQQMQAQTNIVQNGGGQYNMGGYANSGVMVGTTTTTNEMINNYSQNQQGSAYAMAETIGYGTTDTMGNVSAYGTGGLEVIDNTAPGQMPYTTQIQNVGNINQFGSSYNTGMVNQTTKDVVYTTKTLPVKVMETKVNRVIVNNNVNTLPVVYGEEEGQANY